MKAKIYLAKPSGEWIGCPNGIRMDTVNVKFHATDIWEMHFEVDRSINDPSSGRLITSDYYDSIRFGMKLYLDDATYPAYFIISEEPSITIDGNTEVKSVTCRSCESELQNIFKTIQINTGVRNISQEYLIEGNINPYTGLPIEYISLVNYEETEKSLLHLLLKDSDWNVAPGIKSEICQRKYCFCLDHTDIYSFLTQSLAGTCLCFIHFDRKNKTVALIDKEDYGMDTGIFLSYRNLLNKLDKAPINDNSIITKLYPSGSNGLGIYYANFGQDFLTDFDYYANAKDEYGNNKFISKELAEKYNTYIWETDHEKTEYDGKEYTRRELYMELSKKYNSLLREQTELTNRVPNDGCSIDYTTFKYDELIASLKAYQNALYTLITLYKNEYGVVGPDEEPPGFLSPADEEKIKDTIYGYDYAAYKNVILPKIYEALKIWCKTNSKGDLCADDASETSLVVINENTLVPYHGGMATNPAYSDDIIKTIDSYLYDFDLYGLDELNAKRISWLTAADTLYTEGFILEKDALNQPVKYNTPDDTGWNALGNHRKNFTGKSNYIEKLNLYLDYMSFDTRNNSITGTSGKGIIRQCEDKIKDLEMEIAKKKTEMDTINAIRSKLSACYSFDHYFTKEEKKVFTILTNEEQYQNDTILITNLDDSSSEIDKQNDLYMDAKNILYMKSHPQWRFQIQADNLFDIHEMSNLTHDFIIGNYIRVQTNLYKDEFVKLRLIAVETNPCAMTDQLNIEFSDITYTYRHADDFDYIFSKLYKGSSPSSFTDSSSSGGKGNFGSNIPDIQISNNMLNALLSSEKFGTAVTDVILDHITANKGCFQDILAGSIMANSVSVGKTVIDGECLITGQIKSINYNGTNKNNVYQIDNSSGSILNLDDGQFSLAGGKLKWDSNILAIEGNISANSLVLKPNGTMSGISSSNLSDANKIIRKDSEIGIQSANHNSDYMKISSNGLLEADNAIIHGTIYANAGIFNGEISAKNGSIGGYTIGDHTLIGNNVGISSLSGHGYAFWAGNNDSTKAPFRVGHDGKLTASSVHVSGGSICIGDNFVVDQNGVSYLSNATINGDIYAKGKIHLYSQLYSDYIETISIDTDTWTSSMTTTFTNGNVSISLITLEPSDDGEEEIIVVGGSNIDAEETYTSINQMIKLDGRVVLTHAKSKAKYHSNRRPLYIDTDTGEIFYYPA